MHAALRDRGAARRGARGVLRPGDRGRRAQLARPGDVRRHASARASRRGAAATCGWAPSKVFDAFTFVVRETPYGVMQIHGYPYDAHGQHVHHRDARRRLGARRLRRAGADRPRAGRVRREVDRAGPRALRRRPRGARGDRRTTPAGSASPPCATRRWRHEQRRAARRRCAHRALLDRVRHQAGDGGRAGAGGLPARGRRAVGEGAGGVRGRAAPGRARRRSARRRRASSGSRTSASTSTRSRCSSRSTS